MTHRTIDRPHGLNYGMLPDQIMQLLELTGHPWTRRQLADRLNRHDRSVDRALHRLRHRGLVVRVADATWRAA